jgi:hypothetical protein
MARQLYSLGPVKRNNHQNPWGTLGGHTRVLQLALVNGRQKSTFRHETKGLNSEEFYQRRHFKHKRDLARKLKKWEMEYNEEYPDAKLSYHSSILV